jgi:hypothetical protein
VEDCGFDLTGTTAFFHEWSPVYCRYFLLFCCYPDWALHLFVEEDWLRQSQFSYQQPFERLFEHFLSHIWLSLVKIRDYMSTELLVEKVAIVGGKGRARSAVIVFLGSIVGVSTVFNSGFEDLFELGGRVGSLLHF